MERPGNVTPNLKHDKKGHSWNRNIPTGYKIVRIHMEDGVPKNIEDFATGWLKNFTVTGRPVDLIVGDDGSLFVSDDNAGKIYRIYYQK